MPNLRELTGTNTVDLGGGWANVQRLPSGAFEVHAGQHKSLAIIQGVTAAELAHLAAELLAIPEVATFVCHAVVRESVRTGQGLAAMAAEGGRPMGGP